MLLRVLVSITYMEQALIIWFEIIFLSLMTLMWQR